jgi:hypothetical protein
MSCATPQTAISTILSATSQLMRHALSASIAMLLSARAAYTPATPAKRLLIAMDAWLRMTGITLSNCFIKAAAY